MSKKFLLGFAFICICKFSYSQVNNSRVEIDTSIRSAVFMETDMSENTAKDAIESYFDSMHIEKEKAKGFIIKKSTGYLLFRRAKVDYIEDILDFYFVVDNKKQKGNDASVVYIAVSRSNNNFLTPESNNKLWNNLKDFASYLQSNYFEQYKINTSVASLRKDVDKAKKKLVEVEKEKADLEYEISNKSAQVDSLHSQLIKLRMRKM